MTPAESSLANEMIATMMEEDPVSCWRVTDHGKLLFESASKDEADTWIKNNSGPKRLRPTRVGKWENYLGETEAAWRFLAFATKRIGGIEARFGTANRSATGVAITAGKKSAVGETLQQCLYTLVVTPWFEKRRMSQSYDSLRAYATDSQQYLLRAAMIQLAATREELCERFGFSMEDLASWLLPDSDPEAHPMPEYAKRYVMEVVDSDD